MAVSATYNGVTLSVLGKVIVSGDDRVITYSFDALIANVPSSFASLRVWDKDFSITGSGLTTSFSLTSGSVLAVSMRPSVQKFGGPLDTLATKRIKFTVQVELQTAITGISGVREWSVTNDVDEQGKQSLTIRGEVTAISGTDAIANVQAAAPTIEALVYAAFDVEDQTFEQPRTVIGPVDRYQKKAMFTRSRTMLLYAPNQLDGDGAPERDPSIIFPVWRISRVRDAAVGRSDMSLTTYDVSWQAKLLQTDYAGIISQEETSIRALVISKIKAMFGESESLTIERDEVTFDQTGLTASATWRVRANSGFLSYVEKVRLNIKYASHDKLTDGNAFSMARKSVGAVGTLSQSITARRSDFRGIAVTPPAISLPGMPGLALDIESLDLDVSPRYNNITSGLDGNEAVAGDEVQSSFAATYTIYNPFIPESRYISVTQATPNLLGGNGLG